MNIANESGSAEVVGKQKVGEVSLPVDPQTSVNNHFQAAATDWEHIYQARQCVAASTKDRMETTLRWIEELGLPATAHLLEIGCGAGFATVALARRGYRIDALDSVSSDVSTSRASAWSRPVLPSGFESSS